MTGPVRVLFDFHSENYELWNFPRPLYEVFVERFPSVMFHYCTSAEDFRAHLPSAKIVFGRWLRPEDLPLAEQLEWFHTAAAGVERQLYPAFIERQIRLTTSAGARSGAMAEGILGAIIAFNRQFPRLWAAQQRREWVADENWRRFRQLRTLDGQRLLVVGLGSIGQEVARLAKAFGMEVWGIKRDPNVDIPWVDRIGGPDELDEFLRCEPLVVLDALPHTPVTMGMFSAARFAAMGSEALFINVGRGATVVEPALIAALERGVIRGAILDVFAAEPLSPDSPLWQLDNCWVFPHITNIVDRFWEPTAELFLENLRHYVMRLPLVNEVDIENGGY